MNPPFATPKVIHGLIEFGFQYQKDESIYRAIHAAGADHSQSLYEACSILVTWAQAQNFAETLGIRIFLYSETAVVRHGGMFHPEETEFQSYELAFEWAFNEFRNRRKE